jgi:hypothetical protein
MQSTRLEGRLKMIPERVGTTFTDVMATQHRELRVLLATAVGHAFAFENGQRIAHEPLRALLGPLRQAFQEREVSLHGFDQELPFGPQLTERLRREHARQRQEMEELFAWATEADPLDLAGKVDRLARELLSDLAREDLALMMSRRPRPTA